VLVAYDRGGIGEYGFQICVLAFQLLLFVGLAMSKEFLLRVVKNPGELNCQQVVLFVYLLPFLVRSEDVPLVGLVMEIWTLLIFANLLPKPDVAIFGPAIGGPQETLVEGAGINGENGERGLLLRRVGDEDCVGLACLVLLELVLLDAQGEDVAVLTEILMLPKDLRLVSGGKYTLSFAIFGERPIT